MHFSRTSRHSGLATFAQDARVHGGMRSAKMLERSTTDEKDGRGRTISATRRVRTGTRRTKCPLGLLLVHGPEGLRRNGHKRVLLETSRCVMLSPMPMNLRIPDLLYPLLSSLIPSTTWGGGPPQCKNAKHGPKDGSNSGAIRVLACNFREKGKSLIREQRPLSGRVCQ